MPLTALAIRNAKPKDKPYKLTDERGLYLLINPNGSKLWKLKYRAGGVEKKLSFGAYPDVSLADARDKREEARKQIAGDIDPGVLKQTAKRSKQALAENSFETIVREWHTKVSANWTEKYRNRIIVRFEQHVFPSLGKRPITDITASELLTVIRRVESQNIIETARRILRACNQVFYYAAITDRATNNPALNLSSVLAPAKTTHHASIINPIEIGNLLRAIDLYEGLFSTKCALQLAPLLFVRPGELRRAEWSEFDFEKSEWHIPAHKMKMREKHIVPLSTQAVIILKKLQCYTGDGRYLFQSLRTKTRPMSENTINAALRRLGYTHDEITGHGFRSMASTLLNEQGSWNRDAIERQLAHSERNNVRAAYNYAEHLIERRRMMQHWADYLDELKYGKQLKQQGARHEDRCYTYADE